MARKIISIVLSLGLLFQQGGLVYAAGELNLANYLSSMHSAIVQPDVFQPARLRYISYDMVNNDFKLLLDKGNAKLNDATPELFNYFLIGLALPNDTFWVNLRPDAPENIIDPLLEKTDIGKIFLEADLQLKKDTASLTSPQNPEGKLYWDKLYKKAGELFGTENITIPTITRPWIVPNEVIVRETEDSAYIYKATLKVLLEQDHLKDSLTYNFSDPRLKELNEYSSQIIRETIIPKLTKDVNSSKRYAKLRQVYYSLVLSRWFKQKYSSLGSAGASANSYISLIDSGDLANLASKESYDKQTYFQAYQKSFKDGEYNLKETVPTPFGQSIRSYVSGGIRVDNPIKSGNLNIGVANREVTNELAGQLPPAIVGSPLEVKRLIKEIQSGLKDINVIVSLLSQPRNGYNSKIQGVSNPLGQVIATLQKKINYLGQIREEKISIEYILSDFGKLKDDLGKIQSAINKFVEENSLEDKNGSIKDNFNNLSRGIKNVLMQVEELDKESQNSSGSPLTFRGEHIISGTLYTLRNIKGLKLDDLWEIILSLYQGLGEDGDKNFIGQVIYDKIRDAKYDISKIEALKEALEYIDGRSADKEFDRLIGAPALKAGKLEALQKFLVNALEQYYFRAAIAIGEYVGSNKNEQDILKIFNDVESSMVYEDGSKYSPWPENPQSIATIKKYVMRIESDARDCLNKDPLSSFFWYNLTYITLLWGVFKRESPELSLSNVYLKNDPRSGSAGSPLTRLGNFLSALESESNNIYNEEAKNAISRLINTIKQQIRLIEENKYHHKTMNIGKSMIETEWNDLCDYMPGIKDLLFQKYNDVIKALASYSKVAGSPVVGEELEVYDGDSGKYRKLRYVSYDELMKTIGRDKIKRLLKDVVFWSKIEGTDVNDMEIDSVKEVAYIRGVPDESVLKNMRFAIELDKINVKIEGIIETDGNEIIAHGKTLNIANALVGAWAEEKELANVSSAVVSGQVPNKKLDKLGGIDLTDRALYIKLERGGSFASTPLLLPQVKNVQDLDLDKEFEQVEALASSGIVPNSHRLLELFTICHYRGEFGERLSQIISCLKASSAIQEAQAIDSDEDFRLALMMPEVLS